MVGEEQCIFCHIANGKVPAKKVYEDAKVTAVLDINPGADGHVLLVPKQHFAILEQMDEELIKHIGMISKQLSSSLLRAFNVEGMSIFLASGAVAGQRAPHFMLHIIPRKSDDGVGLVLPTNKIDEKTMRAVFSKIAEPIAKNFGVQALKLPESEKEQKEEQKNGQNEEGKTSEKQASKPAPGTKPSNLDALSSFLLGEKK